MSDNHLNINQQLSYDNYSKIDRTPQQELFYQAYSYSLVIRGFIITTILLYFVGIGSLVAGKVPEATIKKGSELTLKILYVLVKMEKQNTDRLDRLSKDKDKD